MYNNLSIFVIMKHIHTLLLPLLIVTLLMSLGTKGYSQDTLYRIDGRVQNVKILEVKAKQIKYKNPEGQGGPTFVLSTAEVQKIVYANGTVIKPNLTDANNYNESIYPETWREEEKRADPLSTNFKRRYVNISVPDYFAGLLTVGYEYFNKKGDYSIRVPVSIGLKSIGLNKYAATEFGEYESKQAYYRENKKFSTGFDCYYYPFGQGKVKYYVGPSIEFGWFSFTDEIYQGPPTYGYKDETQNGSFQSILLMNGFLFQPSAEVNFNLGFGMGYCQSKFMQKDYNNQYEGGDYYATKQSEFAARFSINVGYKFN